MLSVLAVDDDETLRLRIAVSPLPLGERLHSRATTTLKPENLGIVVGRTPICVTLLYLYSSSAWSRRVSPSVSRFHLTLSRLYLRLAAHVSTPASLRPILSMSNGGFFRCFLLGSARMQPSAR